MLISVSRCMFSFYSHCYIIYIIFSAHATIKQEKERAHNQYIGRRNIVSFLQTLWFAKACERLQKEVKNNKHNNPSHSAFIKGTNAYIWSPSSYIGACLLTTD